MTAHAPVASALDLDRDFGLEPGATVAVIAPHPDDEVFAAGGLMAVLQGRGHTSRIIAVTDGEASHANSRRITPEELRTRRRRESLQAYRALGIAPDVRRLGLPDAAVSGCERELRTALCRQLAGVQLVLAPIETDGHADHDACARAAIAVCEAFGLPLWRYAVWARLHPERIVQGESRVFALPEAVRARKRAAMLAYESQFHALGALPEDGPVLPPGFFDRLSEPGEPLWPMTRP